MSFSEVQPTTTLEYGPFNYVVWNHWPINVSILFSCRNFIILLLFLNLASNKTTRSFNSSFKTKAKHSLAYPTLYYQYKFLKRLTDKNKDINVVKLTHRTQTGSQRWVRHQLAPASWWRTPPSVLHSPSTEQSTHSYLESKNASYFPWGRRVGGRGGGGGGGSYNTIQ